MKLYILAAALVLPATAAIANERDDSSDPNRMICRAVNETGSRLSKRKICMSAAQWAEHRRNTQQAVDRAQTTQINKSSNQ